MVMQQSMQHSIGLVFVGREGDATIDATFGWAGLVFVGWDGDGMLRIKAKMLPEEPQPTVPLRSLFWAAGQSFSRADVRAWPPNRPRLSISRQYRAITFFLGSAALCGP